MTKKVAKKKAAPKKAAAKRTKKPAPVDAPAAEEPNGRGRPSKYDQKHDDIARALCKLGATDAMLAEAFDVAESTINLWKLEHESFAQALRAGKLVADAEAAEGLHMRATGFQKKAVKIFQFEGQIVQAEYEEYYPPDVAAATRWLQNRQPGLWRGEKVDHEHTGPNGGPIQGVNLNVSVKDCTAEEAARIYSDFIKAGN